MSEPNEARDGLDPVLTTIDLDCRVTMRIKLQLPKGDTPETWADRVGFKLLRVYAESGELIRVHSAVLSKE